MRINADRKTIDIEERDVEYVMQAYVRLYLFNQKNAEPEKIIFPMFDKVPHPLIKGKFIPIEYIPSTSPIAIEIVHDGSNVPKASEESVAKADKAEKDYDKTKDAIQKLEDEVAPPAIDPDNPPDHMKVSAARAAFAEPEKEPEKPPSAIAGVDSKTLPTPERIAKAKEPPGGAIPPGQSTDYGGRRDAADQRRVARDLAPEKDISEEEEAHEKPADDIAQRAKNKGKK